MSQLRILICGSRDWDDEDVIAQRMDMVPYVLPMVPIVIHGGAEGADKLADNLARERGWMVREFKPDYSTGRGKQAPLDRNIAMLEEGQPHVVWAYQKDGSRGTQHTIDEARKRGIKVTVTTPEVVTTYEPLENVA